MATLEELLEDAREMAGSRAWQSSLLTLADAIELVAAAPPGKQPAIPATGQSHGKRASRGEVS